MSKLVVVTLPPPQAAERDTKQKADFTREIPLLKKP
jgi:hypothetical protein